MKKALIILLCALAVFAIVSCKNEPKPEPEPTPAVETFTVTFNTGEGGSAVPAATVEKDAKVEKPTDPTKKDALFYKWFTEATCENEYSFDTAVTQDITLFAKWIDIPAADADYIKITAGRESDRFQYQWIFDAPIAAGDVISFKYKSNREFSSFTTRAMKAKGSAIEKLADGTAIVDPVADADDWYTFSYTVPAQDVKGADLTSAAIGIGVGLATKNGNTVAGTDYICIKDITYTTATATNKLTITEDNVYSGANGGPIEDGYEYIYKLIATKGTDDNDEGKNKWDKFRLSWTGDVKVNQGDTVSITFKPQRTDDLTKERSFTYSIRGAVNGIEGSGKWFSEKDKTYWTTFSEPDANGWITATYTFPAAADAAEPAKITYPAPFVIDFRDAKFASPAEGRIPDVLYIKSIKLTSGENTVDLVLDKDAMADIYSCPIVEENK